MLLKKLRFLNNDLRMPIKASGKKYQTNSPDKILLVTKIYGYFLTLHLASLFYQILYFFLKPQKERIILTFPYLSLPIPNAFIVIMHINSLVHALTTNYSGPNRCFICLICYLCQKQVSKQHCQSEPAFRINKIESNIHNNKQ